MITRLIENSIINSLFKGKTIIIYGARQVGKTTLTQQILEKFGNEGKYYSCDILSVGQSLADAEPEKLKAFLGDYKVVILDEAQYIPDIGRILKVLTDHVKDIQIIATGSSGFDLAGKTTEPMTGRVITYRLYPFSITEIKEKRGWLEINPLLEKLLVYGSYPEISLLGNEEAEKRIIELASSYLYKDILQFEDIRRSDMLKKLVQMLALQTGNEVNYNELAVSLGVSRLTVIKYIDLLEKTFVLFRLNSFSGNLRKELNKSVKIYFYDTGIRNALINNFNPLHMRNDAGALWENFCIAERKKKLEYSGIHVNSYFWRTYDQKEIDYIEEKNGLITGYEFKYSPKQKMKIPKLFTETYNAEVKRVDSGNYWEFLG